ncbi:hypothetical protein PGT21_035460 [Puccinia graminis f. sp. tritici]|uniref:Uncharacterized protein n=2 Tax=Puccinia graminis f. sp. tritici TaxID=56615 RepID=A0A5B0PSY0_PUCGR|nr:hypothetical protein PGT21_035460 [Puccinia graminis f. sp. tritici]KAA1100295.1 hypothetical protein PGTUg99_010472 [Puccinia graminis f. sp. tritici]KAA1103598.1 hypothetical protein PGTUg99_002412 [Puccinia graminis f. sp. tritici]KAA1133718.1 hypothetical protein PGTUg99_000969 [Puccinia graminis f. sp. tritici]
MNFPLRELSNPLIDQMCDEIWKLIPAAFQSNNLSETQPFEYEWSPELAQQGFQSEYIHSGQILDLILKILQVYASQWSPAAYKVPSTVIIGPMISGKKYLIMELAKTVPVVYICI